MPKSIMNDTKTKMSNAIQAFSRDLAAIRAGRATPSLLDKITVEYYGAPTPINQVAGISVPEARLIMIQPTVPPIALLIHFKRFQQTILIEIRP